MTQNYHYKSLNSLSKSIFDRLIFIVFFFKSNSVIHCKNCIKHESYKLLY